MILYLKQKYCNMVFVGRTEGDAWVKSLSIIFQINEKMFPIKISIWLISSWLIRKETRKSGVLGCIQYKSGEESVTGKKPSVPQRMLVAADVSVGHLLTAFSNGFGQTNKENSYLWRKLVSIFSLIRASILHHEPYVWLSIIVCKWQIIIPE